MCSASVVNNCDTNESYTAVTSGGGRSGLCTQQTGRGGSKQCVVASGASCTCELTEEAKQQRTEQYYDGNPWNNYPYGTYKTDYHFDSSNGETDGSYDDSEESAVLGREFTGDNDDAGTLYNVLSDGTHTTGGGEFLVDEKNIFDIAYHEDDGSSGFYAPEDPLENGMIFTENTYFYVSNETTIEYYVGANDDDSAMLRCGEPGWEGSSTNPDTCYIRNENQDGWGGLSGAETIDMTKNNKHTMTLSPGWHDLRWAYKQDDGSMNAEFWFGSAGEKKSITEYFDAVHYSQGNHPSTGLGNGLQQLAKSENTSEYCRDGIDNDFDWNGNDTLLINESFYGQNNVNVTVQQPGPWPEYSIGRSIDGLPDFGEPGVDVADPQCHGEQGPQIELYGDHRWNEYYENSILSGNITNNESTKPVETSCFDKYDNDFDGRIDFEDDDCAGNRSVNLDVYYNLGEQYFNWSEPANDAICSDPHDLGKVTGTGDYICLNATDGQGQIDTSDPEPGFIRTSELEGQVIPAGNTSYVWFNGELNQCSANSNDTVDTVVANKYTCDNIPGTETYRYRECCAIGDQCYNNETSIGQTTRLGSYDAYRGEPFSGFVFENPSSNDEQKTIDGINYSLPPGGKIHVTLSTADDSQLASLEDSTVTVSSPDSSETVSLDEQPHDAKTGQYNVVLNNSLDRVTEITTDLKFETDNIGGTLYYVHGVGVMEDSQSQVCGDGWRRDYDTVGDSRTCEAFFGDDAATENYCCGDDVVPSDDYGERYPDGQNGCWYGQTMQSDQLLSEITKNSTDNTVLYHDDQFYQCNGGRDANISYNQSTMTTTPLFTNKDNYETVGDFICEPQGWRERLDGGSLFTMAAILQNYTEAEGVEEYSLLCGSADQVVNELPSEATFEANINGCALRTGPNKLQDGQTGTTILLLDKNVTEAADYIDATSSEFIQTDLEINTSSCNPSSSSIDLELCDAYPGYGDGSGGEETPKNVQFYADTSAEYTAMANAVIDAGAFDSNTWSFTNNPITEFFGYLVGSVTNIFTTSDLPLDGDSSAQALYVAEGVSGSDEFLIASGVYGGGEGDAPFMKTDFNGSLFTKSEVERTLQRYDSSISGDQVDSNGDGVNVTAPINAEDTSPVDLWKQMTVSTR